MLLRHSAAYLLTRSTSAAIQLVALSVFSHLVSPAQYGRYALAVVFTFTARALIFEWLYLGVLRLLPSDARSRPFLATVIACYLVLSSACVLAGVLIVVLTNQDWILVSAAIALLLAAAFHEINLQVAARQLSPGRYATLAIIKASCILVLGAVGAMSELAENGLLIGVAAGYGLSSIVLTFRIWRVISIRHAAVSTLCELARYGLPLGVTAGLGLLVWNTDRLVLGYLIGPEAVGSYALGAELAAQSVGMLMTTINLAAFPLALQALERHGVEGARERLNKQAILLGMIALPSAAALAVFSTDLSLLALGSQFQNLAAPTMGWIAFAALLNGLRAYYFDLAFQLGQRTAPQIAITAATGVVNILLNLGLVSAYGAQGAAIATTSSAALGVLLSLLWGRNIFAMPIPILEWGKCICASVAVAWVVHQLTLEPGISRMFWGLLVAAACFSILAWMLNVAGLRSTKMAASGSGLP
jgi:O-antigen/teichoic acid export membrane protein